jgi:hypothetical protein
MEKKIKHWVYANDTWYPRKKKNQKTTHGKPIEKTGYSWIPGDGQIWVDNN